MESANHVERQGFCTKGCGACCRYIKLQVAPNYMSDPDIRNWIQLHGIGIHEGPQGSAWAHIPIPCTQLTPDGLCALNGSPRRPVMCGQWPYQPADLIGFEKVCTYSFVEVADAAV